MNKIDLTGSNAVVTGGAQGIGRACTERMLASGANVMIWDRDIELANSTVEELSTQGSISAIEVDVSDWDAVQKATGQTKTHFDTIDILVNNAGISGLNAPVTEYPVDEWHRVIQLNLNGVFYCCKAIAPIMQSNNYGRIVSIASIAGKEGNPNGSAYSASKAGVIALTKSLGKELVDHDIGVACVTPTVAKTAIFEQMTQQHIDYMLAKVPRGRFVRVEEIAAMVTWLASSDNSFATGAVFDISGGRATY